MTSPTVADVVQVIDGLYPPQFQESWDSVGLIVGDTSQSVRHIRLAIDPVEAVVREACNDGVDFLLTHHPLFLRGTSSVATTHTKGRVVHQLIEGGCALMNAHTNADVAPYGVAEALADAVGLPTPRIPLLPHPDHPAIGLGRVADFATPISVRDFSARVAQGLPASPSGVLVSGDLDRMVRRVAVSGGAGDSLLVRTREMGVECFVTADLRHHPASEHCEDGGAALIVGSHWATEYPWVHVAAAAIRKEMKARGWHCDIDVSSTVTEAWSLHRVTGGEA